MNPQDFNNTVAAAARRVLLQHGPLHIGEIVRLMREEHGVEGEGIERPVRKSRYEFVRIGSDETYDLVHRPAAAEPAAEPARALVEPDDLFGRLGADGKRAVLGLVGELLAIRWAVRPDLAVDYWHQIPDEPFHFSYQGDKLNVKSCLAADGLKIDLGLAECQPPQRGLLAVLRFRCSPAGRLSIDRLARAVEDAIRGHELLLTKLRYNIRKNLDDSMRRVMTERVKFIRFDLAAPAAIYDLQHIPALRTDSPAAVPGTLALPPGVDEVRFRTDLAGMPPVRRCNVPASLREIWDFDKLIA